MAGFTVPELDTGASLAGAQLEVSVPLGNWRHMYPAIPLKAVPPEKTTRCGVCSGPGGEGDTGSSMSGGREGVATSKAGIAVSSGVFVWFDVPLVSMLDRQYGVVPALDEIVGMSAGADG